MENINEEMEGNIAGKEKQENINREDDLTQVNVNDVNEEADSIIERVLARQSTRRRLSLIEAPEFLVRLGSYKEVSSGETVVFSAQYRAFPRPAVKWFKNEEEIHESSRQSFESPDEEEGIIRFVLRNVDISDEGTYKCVVENQEGAASTTGYLTVIGRLQKERTQQSTPSVPQSTASPSPPRKTDRAGTPSSLRPIIEQKSMEDREAEECCQQGPSPLQEFIDVVQRKKRRFSKRTGPLVFCPDDLFYAAEQDSFDKTFESGEESFGVADSDTVLSPPMTPVLTPSSPELADIWEASPYPCLSCSSSPPSIPEEPRQVTSKHSPDYSTSTPYNDDIELHDAGLKTSNTADDQSVDSCYLTGYTVSGSRSLSTARDEPSVSSEAVQETYDSDYDSDATPTSASEVHISELLVDLNSRVSSETDQSDDSIFVSQLVQCYEEPCSKLDRTISDRNSEATKSEACVSKLDIPTKKFSLQQRRSRLFSRAMHRRAIEEPPGDDIQVSPSLSPSRYAPLRLSIKTFGRIAKEEEDTSGIVIPAEEDCKMYHSLPNNSKNNVPYSEFKKNDQETFVNTSASNEASNISNIKLNQDRISNSSEDYHDANSQIQETKSCLSELVVLMNSPDGDTLSKQISARQNLQQAVLLQTSDAASSQLNQASVTSVKVTSRIDLSNSQCLQKFKRPASQVISIVTGKTSQSENTMAKIMRNQNDNIEQSTEDLESKTYSKKSNEIQAIVDSEANITEPSLPIKTAGILSPSSETRWPSLQAISQLRESSSQCDEAGAVKLRKSAVARSFVIEQVAIRPLVPSSSHDSPAVNPFHHIHEISKCETALPNQPSDFPPHLEKSFIPQVPVLNNEQNTESQINFDELWNVKGRYTCSVNEDKKDSLEPDAGVQQAFDLMLKCLDTPSVQFYLLFTTISTALAAAAGTVSAFSPPLLVVSGALVVVVTESLRLLIERGRRPQLLTSFS